MKLDELLKDDGSSSKWKLQRKQLIRIMLGISVIMISLISAGIYLFYNKENKIPDEPSSESLTQLIELQQETQKLQKRVKNLKENKNEYKPKPSKHKQGSSTVVYSNPNSAPQIIDYEPGEGFLEITPKKENIYIPTGAVFRARLITPIKTSLDKTFVMAETTNEFRMDSIRKIPKGSRIIGRSRLNPLLRQVIVEFETLVLPSGIETRITGLALSKNALPAIDGLYFSNDLQNYGTALAFGFLSGFADASKQTDSTIWGEQPKTNLNNQLLQGLSTSSFQIAEDMLRDIREHSVEYMIVPAGEPIFVALTRRYEINQGE